jgi:peroxiredoxin
MKKTKLLLLVLITICTGAFRVAAAPKVGAPAPEFSLPDSHGKTHSLGDLKGKYVVLEWFNPECPFVQKHYKSDNMQNLQKEFTGKGVVWLTIDSSAEGKEGYLTPVEANKQIADWKIKSSALLLDPEGKVGHEYAATNTPHMYIIDPDGKLVYSGAIDNRPTPNPDDISGATNYVKVALEETMAGKPVTTANSRAYGCSIKYAR